MITQPPFLFQSNMKGSARPFFKNWDVRKVSLKLFFLNRKISICFITSSQLFKLFASEFRVILLMTGLFTFLRFRFKNHLWIKQIFLLDLFWLSKRSEHIFCFNCSQNKKKIFLFNKVCCWESLYLNNNEIYSSISSQSSFYQFQ